MKKTCSILLSVIMMLGICVPFASAAENDFVPVLRFIASSDTHVKGGDDNTNSDRIKKMLGEAYAISDSDDRYSGLDAFIVAGDLTNDGTQEEFDKFWGAVSSSKRDSTVRQK